ncbi:hypothetical protein, partial [Piscirickettsia litoralis]|uniref:hypothetical protein n=1 Tax=Piscirickettsia litoralis TaxID=1891921 RepID=UPI001300E29E
MSIFKQLKSAQKKGVAIEVDCSLQVKGKDQRICHEFIKGCVLSVSEETVKLKSFMPPSVKIIDINKIF